jgi:hypothetical protein
MKITGIIRTTHDNPECIAESVAADNLNEMETQATTFEGSGVVETTITSTKIRSVIASVDDYLANLTVAEELCKKGSDKVSEH